jgi:hypothetical protein
MSALSARDPTCSGYRARATGEHSAGLKPAL